MTRILQDARDFAGADWEAMRASSRAKLLDRSHLPQRFTGWRWRQLPETAQMELAKTVIRGKR